MAAKVLDFWQPESGRTPVLLMPSLSAVFHEFPAFGPVANDVTGLSLIALFACQ